METESLPEQHEMSPLVEEIKMLEGIAKKKLGRDEYVGKLQVFLERLRKKYPEWEHSEVYHALAESTVMPEMGPPITGDFPGDDSAVLFLRDLIY